MRNHRTVASQLYLVAVVKPWRVGNEYFWASMRFLKDVQRNRTHPNKENCDFH